MKLTRRTFIQASAATAGLLLAGCATQPETPVTSAMAVRKAKAAGPAKGEWVATACQGCTQWCAIQIYVQEGRAVRVRGNPNSKTNHGFTCPRGHLIPQQTYDPDRIKVPMKRTNPAKGRGVDPKFVPITWDEALDLVASKMMELRNNKESHKFAYIRGRYSPTSTDLLYGTLPKIFGTPQYFSHSAICAEAEKMGPGLTQGFFGYRDYDLANTNCLVAWGTDPLASNRMVPNTIHRFGEILARGTIIAVDPRLSNSAAKAQEWLPIKPGTDGALAGAIAHLMLTEGLWNREFVGDFKEGRNLFVAGKTVDEGAFAEKETHGLVKWWNLELKDRTPAWAAKETLIPAAQIVRVARAIGKAAPKVAVWMGPGVAMNPRGTYAAMAVHALNGLAGSIDVEGGTLQSSSVPIGPFPKSDAYVDDVAKAGGKGKKIDGRGDKDMPAMMNAVPGSGVVTNNIANGMLKDPGAVKVLMSSWSNFNFSCTDPGRWDKALAKVPFFDGLTVEALAMIAHVTTEESYAYGTKIFAYGDPGDKLYIVVEGKVRIFREVGGMGEEALAVLGAGEVFGEMSLLDESTRSAGALAHEKCKLLVITKDAFDDLLFLHKDLAYEVLWACVRMLAARLRETNDKLTFLSTTGRF